MKFAVLKLGGKQHIVESGQVLTVEKMKQEVGEKVVLDEVLATFSDSQIVLGKPLTGGKVEAEVLEHGFHDKISVIRYMPKSRWSKKKGHKQPFTKIKVLEVK